jgi:5-methyltetrahydropteroyltriglutamate--homocysteine methyltransferase
MYAGSVHDVTRGINEAVAGVSAKIAVHVCFGNLYGRPFSAVRDYRNLLPLLGELKASQVILEFANRGLDDAARLADWPRHLELGAGVVDVKAFRAETAEEVAARIRALLARGVAPERLWLTPDCGFWETPRQVVKRKLAALAQGAAIVRGELAGGA